MGLNSGLQPSQRTRLGAGDRQESSPSPSPRRTSTAQGTGGSARHDPIHQLQPREDPHRSAEWEEGSAPLASTACISSLSCTPFKFRPEQHSKGITVADCGTQGNPQLHNKRDRKGCQWGSKDISTFKGCSCSQKTCSGITTVPWVQANSRAPARHSPLPGDFKARTLTGPVQGCCRVRADSSALQSTSPTGHKNAANIPPTTANHLQISLQAQPPRQQLPRVPRQMPPDPQAVEQVVSRHLHLSADFLLGFSRQGLHSGRFPRESFLSPNSQECQFTLMSDEPGLALLLSGEFCSAACLKQQEAACQRQGERFHLFRQNAVPGCPR